MFNPQKKTGQDPFLQNPFLPIQASETNLQPLVQPQPIPPQFQTPTYPIYKNQNQSQSPSQPTQESPFGHLNQNPVQDSSEQMLSSNGQESDDEGEDDSMDMRHYAADFEEVIGGQDDRKIHLSPHLNLPLKSINDVWTIYGKRGSGKSYFLGKLCEELSRLTIPFIIIDVKGAHKLINLPNLAHLHMGQCSEAKLVERLGAGESLIVACKGATVDDLRTYVKNFCDIISRAGFGPKFGRPVVVALEECHNFIGQGQGSAGGKTEIRSQCVASVDKLIREGRQDGVGIVLISQSVANVLANARRQAEIKVIFNIRDHTDINQLKNTLVGRNKGDVDKLIDQVYYFDVGEFICVSPTYITLPGVVTDKTAERTTEHAGRSYIEEGMGDLIGESDSLNSEIDVSNYIGANGGMNVAVAGDNPDDIDAEHDQQDLFSAASAPAKKPNKVDYKSAFGMSLLALSVLGLVFVFVKKRMEQRDEDKEKEVGERVAKEMQKYQSEQAPQAQGEMQPQQVPFTQYNDDSAPPTKSIGNPGLGLDDLDEYDPWEDEA